jgi:hypothetical protein
MDGFYIVIQHVQLMVKLSGVLKWRLNKEKANGKKFIRDQIKYLFKSSSAPVATRHPPKHGAPSGSSLISVDMGLSVTPYQIRPLNTPTNSDLNQRFRRLHMRAPLRPLITAATDEYPLPLEINAHSLGNRHDIQRRPSLLSTPSLIREEVRRVNIEFNHDFPLPPSIIGRRLLERRRSNAK